MSNTPFLSKRAPFYADIPDDKWNNWRWQLSNRINTVEEFEKIIPLTDSECKALSASNLFRVEITPYFGSLIDPDDPDDPTLAATPAATKPAHALEAKLAAAGVVNVSLISLEQEAAAAARRGVRVKAALESPARSGPRPAVREEPPRAQRALAGTLAASVERLPENETQLLAQLDLVQTAVVRAIGAGELTQALEALLPLIAPGGDRQAPGHPAAVRNRPAPAAHVGAPQEVRADGVRRGVPRRHRAPHAPGRQAGHQDPARSADRGPQPGGAARVSQGPPADGGGLRRHREPAQPSRVVSSTPSRIRTAVTARNCRRN